VRGGAASKTASCGEGVPGSPALDGTRGSLLPSLRRCQPRRAPLTAPTRPAYSCCSPADEARSHRAPAARVRRRHRAAGGRPGRRRALRRRRAGAGRPRRLRAGDELVGHPVHAPGPDRPVCVCGHPAPEVSVRIGPDGRRHVAVPDRTRTGRHRGARVPAGGAVCHRRLGADAPVAEISLAGSPGSDVSSNQVAWGLGMAVLLGAGALYLLVRGDWRDPEGDPFFGMKADRARGLGAPSRRLRRHRRGASGHERVTMGKAPLG
jgi:hypothetical protein